MMKRQDWITHDEAAEAISLRPQVYSVIEQLRLFPGILVERSIAPRLKLTESMRIETAKYCQEKKRANDEQGSGSQRAKSGTPRGWAT